LYECCKISVELTPFHFNKKFEGEYVHLAVFALEVIAVLAIREKTRRDYLSALNCHVFPRFGESNIASLTKNDIQEVVRELDPPIAAKTLAALKTIFREAIDYGHLEISPTIGVKTKPNRSVPRKFLRWEEVKAGDFGKYQTQVRFLGAHGLRWSEALALTPSDFVDGRILVTKSIHGESKSKSSVRVVPQLTEFKEFPRSPKTLRNVLDPYGVCIHSLRHTYAYLLKQQGIHVTTAQRLLGHSDSRITLNIYTQVLDEEIDSAGVLLRSKI
jgi:integrase